MHMFSTVHRRQSALQSDNILTTQQYKLIEMVANNKAVLCFVQNILNSNKGLGMWVFLESLAANNCDCLVSMCGV